MVRLKYFSDSTISRGSIGLFFSILIFTSYFTAPNIRFHVVYSAASAKLSNTSLSIMNRTKTVLMTSRSFWGFRFQEGRHGFINAGCEINNCILTKNHSYLPDYAFDAFLVHMPTQRKGPWILPNRKNYQIFIFFSTEPPDHMPPLDPFENYFNLTMGYLTNSDIHIPYGWIEPLESAPKTEKERLNLQTIVRESAINPARGKSKLAIWLVTNCQARSNRLEYVRQLQKFVPIDIISSKGKCGGEDLCPKEKNDDVCYDMIEQTYKFYLSFENSICKEYVTEKFFNAIARNIVPIVLGGADYASIAPRHSYINALDFRPQQLAEYLIELDRNDHLYAEYFWWKPHYRVLNLHHSNKEAFCNLCSVLHSNNPMKTKISNGLQKWYVTQSDCQRPKFNET